MKKIIILSTILTMSLAVHSQELEDFNDLEKSATGLAATKVFLSKCSMKDKKFYVSKMNKDTKEMYKKYDKKLYLQNYQTKVKAFNYSFKKESCSFESNLYSIAYNWGPVLK